MRALPGCPATTRGCLSVFLGRIVVAEISLVFQVASSGSKTTLRERNSAHAYRRIFASYSHKDLDVVREFERYAEWIGDQYLRDVVQLRTGELWNDGLKRLIDQAQLFQLFWSSNSMNSRNVEEEWRYATSLQRPNFIRPVYWEEPMPETSDHSKPPQELRRLHFHKVEVKLRKEVDPSLSGAVPQREREAAEREAQRQYEAEWQQLALEVQQREEERQRAAAEEQSRLASAPSSQTGDGAEATAEYPQPPIREAITPMPIEGPLPPTHEAPSGDWPAVPPGMIDTRQGSDAPRPVGRATVERLASEVATQIKGESRKTMWTVLMGILFVLLAVAAYFAWIRP